MRCGFVGCILIRIAVLVSATDDEMVQAVTSEKIEIPIYEPGTDLLNAPELYLKKEGKIGDNLSAKYEGPKFISEFAIDGKPLGAKNDPARCKLLDWKRRRKREDFIISKLNELFTRLKKESKLKDAHSQKMNFSDLISLLKNNTGVKGGVETDLSLSLINTEEPQCHTFTQESEAIESTPRLNISASNITNQESPIEKKSDAEVNEPNTTVKEELSLDVSKISETESPIVGDKMTNDLISGDFNTTNKDENSLFDFQDNNTKIRDLSEVDFKNQSSALVTTTFCEEGNQSLSDDMSLRDKRLSDCKKGQNTQKKLASAQNCSNQQHTKIKRFHDLPDLSIPLPLPLTLQEEEDVSTMIKKIKNDNWRSKTDDETSNEISNLTDAATESLDLITTELDTKESIMDLSSLEPECFNNSNAHTTDSISLVTSSKEMEDQIDDDIGITHQPKAKIIITGSIISNADLVKPDVLSARPVSLVDSFGATVTTHASTKKLLNSEMELMQRSSDCHPKGTGPLTPTDYDPEAYGQKSEEEVEDALTGKLADRVVEVVMAKACKCPRMLKELGLYAQSNLTCLKYSLSHPESKSSCQSQSTDALKATVLHDICEAVERLANTKSQGMCLKPPEDLAEFLSFLLTEDPDMDLPEPAPVIMPRREVDYLFKAKTNFIDEPSKEYYNSNYWLDSLKSFNELPENENYFNPHMVPLVNGKDNFFESMERILNTKDQQWNDAVNHFHDTMDRSHHPIDHYHESKNQFHNSNQFLASKNPNSETKTCKKVFKPHHSRKKDKKPDGVIRKRYTPWSLYDYP